MPSLGSYKPGGRILVVDDEDAVRALASRILDRIGFEALTANDGESALEIYRQEGKTIRAIVLDMAMPRMNGAETLAELQKIDPDVKVVLSSGFGEASTTALAEAGRVLFLQKAYRPQELDDRLPAPAELIPVRARSATRRRSSRFPKPSAKRPLTARKTSSSRLESKGAAVAEGSDQQEGVAVPAHPGRPRGDQVAGVEVTGEERSGRSRGAIVEDGRAWGFGGLERVRAPPRRGSWPHPAKGRGPGRRAPWRDRPAGGRSARPGHFAGRADTRRRRSSRHLVRGRRGW